MRQIVMRHRADEPHAIGHAAALRQGAERRLPLPLADQQERDAWKVRQRRDHQILPLARDQRAQGGDDRALQPQLLAQRAAVDGPEARLIAAGIVHRNPVRFHA